MKKILWQTRSPIVYASFESEKLLNGANGGNSYDFHAASALNNHFVIRVDKKTVMLKNESTIGYWIRMKSYTPKADIIIKEPYPIVFGKTSNKAKQVAMIHHVDEYLFSKDFRHQLFFNRMKKRLVKMDLVITVSKYWENYLKNLGCSKVKVIYNSFNLSDYLLNEEEINKFKIHYKLNSEQPLIYIGNAHRLKGVYEVYESLKNYPYQLVMTGSTNRATDLPVKFLSLNRHDYLCLLHASDLVITFSTMVEGWNRIAHEALLCKTPVIGSGKGGMKELLEDAGQKIVTDKTKLLMAVKDILKEKRHFAEKGFEYVRKYNSAYFEKEWVETILKLINK